MLSGSQVGYARMTRRWMAPIRAEMDAQGLADRPIYFVSSNTHSLVNLRHGHGALARGGDRRPHRRARPGLPARGARSASARAAPRARGRTSSTSARGCSTTPSPRTARSGSGAWRASARSASRTSPAARRCASRAQVMALDRLDPAGLDPRLGPLDAEQAQGLRGGDRQHRVSARPRRLQHPARAHRGQRRAARRLRARQGRDAQRRRRRRPDLGRHPRRALGLDVLARQRVLLRRHRAVPGASARAWTTSAR